MEYVPVAGTIHRFSERGNEHFWPYYIGYWGNIFGNIILFMPFGFLVTLLYPTKQKLTVLLFGFFASIGIECIQYLFVIGVSDIDDVILNTIGTAAGIFVAREFLITEQKQ